MDLYKISRNGGTSPPSAGTAPPALMMAGRRTKERLKGDFMKNWTIDELFDLWRDRGYSKKEARAMAEKDYNEMHRKKSDIEKHQIMQEMIYN